MTDYKVVVDKSTVPVGTGDKVQAAIAEQLTQRGLAIDFSVVSNPEFLKEGAAVADFMRPDRVVIGADEERAILLMRSLYAPFVRNHDRVLVMDRRSAEFTKYAANVDAGHTHQFHERALAGGRAASAPTSRWCARASARIRASACSFLYAGAGYGGSCFPKDVKALARICGRRWQPAAVAGAPWKPSTSSRSWCWSRRSLRRFGEDLHGKTLRAVGPGLQAQHRRHARGAQPRASWPSSTRRGARCAPTTPWPAQEAAA